MFTPKKISFSREGITSGLNKLASAVESTLGPGGRPVVIESTDHTRGITVTKDGVTVAKSISLLDAEENLGVRIMREASERTASEAGDGTTTAIVLARALVEAVNANIDFGEVNRIQFMRDLEAQLMKVESLIDAKSKRLTRGLLRDVATISANNDPELGGIIASVFKAVGKTGVVTVEQSDTHDTYFEVTKGIRFGRGLSNPLFVNNHKKDECVFENAYVFISDVEINNILQIETLLKAVVTERVPVLFIATMKPQVMNTLAANVVKNGLEFCVVQPPDFGWRQNELMSDIALATGGKFFSEKSGDNLNLATLSDLGRVHRCVVGRDTTVLVADDEKTDKEAILSRVEELKVAQASPSTTKSGKAFISQRIASLSGGIGVVYVGGDTDLEQKERYDRVDDAVCAVESALQEGVLPGGGVALWRLATELVELEPENKAAFVLGEAMCMPLMRIAENSGLDPEKVVSMLADSFWSGYDAKGELAAVNCLDAGVVDPAKVTRTALRSAVSVAITMLSANAIITAARDVE